MSHTTLTPDTTFAEEKATFHVGSPLLHSTPVATIEAVSKALQTVFDPEIPVNVYDLGLIYDIRITEGGYTKIWMTLTAPGCPVAGILPVEVANVAAAVPGVGEVDVFLVWDPPWTLEHMSEVARITLDLF